MNNSVTQYNVTQCGKALSKSKYTIDLTNKTFSSKEDDLVLDFSECFGWTFKTGKCCTFTTGWNCTFTTGDKCTFNTCNSCTFNTGYSCTFTTNGHGTFSTSSDCTFDTSHHCTFKTYDSCTFNTGECCTFMVYNVNSCKFESTDDISTILDIEDNKRYVLDKEFIQMQKLLKG